MIKLYTREQMMEAFNYGQTLEGFDWIEDMIDSLTPIELPSDEEIKARFNKFIDTDVDLGFLTNKQGERLKWYYTTYFNEIQGGKQ